ncbi:hypothetical protein [Gordonia soli]|uniref:Uncharacterized protein n=1 Tax=Gordonia soli NBRC 108243 TaxID=1223545 RepID=M0QR99_9ACTN|nr:hypothetical protein [Gordonia soli]GAC70821.1 hypothetical protein GS4_41_00710 [Gordonia soli NBRC 108243]
MTNPSGYTMAELAAWRDLKWSRYNHLLAGSLTDLRSARERLIDRGHDADVVDRIALPSDYRAYVGRYREYFVSDEEREPELSTRDHLIRSCGYPADKVDAYLAEREVEAAENARRRAEREAYERTWRYRARQAWRETRRRVHAAWWVLLHGECDREDW